MSDDPSTVEARRRVALQAAASAAPALPAGLAKDPESLARRVISLATIFEEYLREGARSQRESGPGE